MRFGVHIRTDRGLLRALDQAQRLGCETVQLFSGSPTRWARKPLDMQEALCFAEKARSLDIRPIIVHAPYLVNPASPDDAVWNKSRDALADTLARTPSLGGDLVVTHIGSHKGAGWQQGVGRVVQAVRHALAADDRVTIALELGAGSGTGVGARFDEVAQIIDRLAGHPRVAIAIDTAHLYAAGYDVSNPQGVDAMFADIRRLVGLDRLRLIHLNDTLAELGSHRDRHHHIGCGRIGREGFRAIVNHPASSDLPGIIETPAERDWDERNLRVLRSLSRRAR